MAKATVAPPAFVPSTMLRHTRLNKFLPVLASIGISLGALSAPAQEIKPLDARLTGYGYPYPVSTFALTAQGQELEMAYMDVPPLESNGRTVLLLHGKNFSGAYWGTTIDSLTVEGYRVIVPDQIGFGKSSKPQEFQYTFEVLAQNTQKLLEALSVGKVTVVGHSMGGMLGTRYALMFPDQVERLILVNPIGLEDWKAQGVPYQGVEAWYEQELKQTPEKVQEYMRNSYFAGEWKNAYDPLLEIQAGWIKGPDYPLIARNSALTYDMIFTQPVVHEFERLTVPVNLIIGQRDRTALGKAGAPPEVAEKLGDYPALGKAAADAIPRSTLVELVGIGHVPQFEAFDRYMAALLDALKAVPAPAPDTLSPMPVVQPIPPEGDENPPPDLTDDGMEIPIAPTEATPSGTTPAPPPPPAKITPATE